MQFLHGVNQEKFQQSDEELEQRLDCIVERSHEAAKFRRKKVPIGWDIWSSEMKELINDYIHDVENILQKTEHRGLPVDYTKELWELLLIKIYKNQQPLVVEKNPSQFYPLTARSDDLVIR